VLCAETDGRVGILFMGTRAHGTLRRAVEGSVSTRVLRHAHAPVVVCPARRPLHPTS
jgi:nucleotide-binding universal stress UspA family protein